MGNNDKVVVLIPKGFRLIAKTELGNMAASVYHNPDEFTFIAVLNSQVIGPFSNSELAIFSHVLEDVCSMKESYVFLE